MKCPFQMGMYVASCRADKVVYVPSLFEFKEYCKSKRYTICPFYLHAATMHERPLRLLPPRVVKIE